MTEAGLPIRPRHPLRLTPEKLVGQLLPSLRRTETFRDGALQSKGDAIRQALLFRLMSLQQSDRGTCNCRVFSYSLHAPSCRISLHLGSVDTLLPRPRAYAMQYAAAAIAKNETRERPARQCSTAWATISKTTIARVARDAPSTKRVRRFSRVVIVAR